MKTRDKICEKQFMTAMLALGFSPSLMKSFFRMVTEWDKENEALAESVDAGRKRLSDYDDLLWVREIAATKRATMKSLNRMFYIFYISADDSLPNDLDSIVWRKKPVTRDVYNREVRKLRKAFVDIIGESKVGAMLLKHWRNYLDTRRVALSLDGKNKCTPQIEQANAFLKILEGSARKRRTSTKPK